MELTIPVLVFIYRPVFVICVLGMVSLLFLLKEKERALLFLLIVALCSHLWIEGKERSSFSSVLPQDSLVVLCGRVATEPTRRKNRGKGYLLELTSAMDAKGNAGSARGTVYVISSFSDVTLGDSVTLAGSFGENFFLASSTEIRRRNVWGRGRRKIELLLERHLPKGEDGNLGALLFSGSSLDGSTALSDAARKYGLSYLLALSGMHLGLFQMLLFPLFSSFLSKRTAKLLVFCFLSFFVYSTGWKPSLFRALLFSVLAPRFGTAYGFDLSLVFLLFFQPLSAVDLGTALSFLSLAGLLLFSRPLGRIFDFFLPCFSSLGDAVAASLSALVFAAPYTLSTFGSWQPMAILLAFPASILIVVLFFLELLSLFVPALSPILQKGLGFLLQLSEKEPLLASETTLRLWWPMAVLALLAKLGEVFLLYKKRWKESLEKGLSELKDILALWKG